MNFNFKKNEKGFTIIEAVVSAGVFAFVVVSALGVYLSVVQLDAKSRAERTVQQNARFIMDYIAKEIRNGSIDYTQTNDDYTLNLINQLDEQETFNWNGTDLILSKSGIGSTELNSDQVSVTRFKSILNPSVNPFDLANDTHVQPHVTIILQLQSKNSKAAEGAVINLQSTFAVRDYPSRQP